MPKYVRIVLMNKKETQAIWSLEKLFRQKEQTEASVPTDDELTYKPYFGKVGNKYYIQNPSYKKQPRSEYERTYSVLNGIEDLQVRFAELYSSHNEADRDDTKDNDSFTTEHTCPRTGRILIEVTKENKLEPEVTNEALPETALPDGCYEIGADRNGIFLVNYSFSSDHYLSLGNNLLGVQKEIDVFVESRDRYLAKGLLQKRGILLYGPPGNGKSMFIENLVKQYQEKAVVIYVKDLSHAILLKGLLDDRMKIFVLEEFTEGHMDKGILNILDGPDAMDRMLVIATTNYPERIPMNLIDRPGRLDSLYEIGLPSDEVRREYLFAKFDIDNAKELDEIVALTKGYSLAYLKDMIVRCAIFDQPVSQVIKEFQSRKEKIDQFIKTQQKQRREMIGLSTDED